MDKETTEFVIYIINELANKFGKYPSQIYRILEKTDCINKYLVPFYDILHTLSSERVVLDVVEYITSRGAVI